MSGVTLDGCDVRGGSGASITMAFPGEAGVRLFQSALIAESTTVRGGNGPTGGAGIADLFGTSFYYGFDCLVSGVSAQHRR